MGEQERLSKIGKFLSAYRATKDFDLACLKVKLKKETVRRWLKKYPEFALDFAIVDYTEFAKVENVLLEKIYKEKDLRAVMYYLDRKGAKYGYGKPQEAKTENESKNETIVIQYAQKN